MKHQQKQYLKRYQECFGSESVDANNDDTVVNPVMVSVYTKELYTYTNL